MNSQEKVSHLDFEQIVEHSLDAVIIIRAEQVVYANHAAKQLFPIEDGIPGGQISLSSCIRSKDMAILHGKIHRVLFQESDHEIVNLSILSKGEITKPVEVTVNPLSNAHETLILLTIRDISERKAAEEGMMQSEKLSVIGELSAGILHEVRNPLTSIKGFLQLLKNESTVNKEYINIITSEVEQIEHIANELLYFTKPKKEHFMAQDLLKIAKETLFLFETEAFKKKVKLSLQTDGHTHLVPGDKTQLKQAFVNLVKNALEATSSNGQVTLSLTSVGSLEQVKIEDTGKGIPKDLLSKLGKSFFTTKESGTGLGLMVTYNIVRNHNGKMTIDSKENIGTTFTITFPHAN
ncbi:PAS domain S-box protein [Sporolactobacillus sp. THM7-4]|nr:PAS domain S-box protein [Sporolactobacillus sp. THM7-4]